MTKLSGYQLELLDTLPEPAFFEEVSELNDRIFGVPRFLYVEAATKHNLVLVTARTVETHDLVGFKMGYEDRPQRFYSWLGGVDVAHRRRGLASEMMRMQHEHCRAAGYRVVRTHTRNRFRGMLILNIRWGFDIIGTYARSGEEVEILLEKQL